MKYVFITNGIVTDLAQIDPFKVFQADYARQFIEAPDEVTHWWTYDGTTFSAPVVAPQHSFCCQRLRCRHQTRMQTV
jgi:hypothetical protein